MTTGLSICIIVFSLFLIFLCLSCILKRKIPVKYALIWLIIAVILLLLTAIPGLFIFFADLIGFKTMASFIVAVFISILLVVTLLLTIIISNHKRQIILLVQEVSILKMKVEKLEKQNKEVINEGNRKTKKH